MKNVLILISLSLALYSNAVAGGRRAPDLSVASPTPAVSSTPTPVSTAAKVITLKCNSTCNASERAELPLIEAKLNSVILSDCFAKPILDPANRIDYTFGWTREVMLKKLREPTELTVDYYYNRWTKAVGYESASDFGVIHLNRAKVSSWSVCEKSSLAGHEFSHTKKFYHNGNKPGPNYYSMPYFINRIFEGGGGLEGCCK